MNWKGYGIKRILPNLRYYSDICLEALSKTIKISVRIASLQVCNDTSMTCRSTFIPLFQLKQREWYLIQNTGFRNTFKAFTITVPIIQKLTIGSDVFIVVRVQIVAFWIMTPFCHHKVTNISEEHIDSISPEAACQSCGQKAWKSIPFLWGRQPVKFLINWLIP